LKSVFPTKKLYQIRWNILLYFIAPFKLYIVRAMLDTKQILESKASF